MSAAIGITQMDHTPAELRALAEKCDDAGRTRRLLAIAMILDVASRQKLCDKERGQAIPVVTIQ